MYLVLPNNLNYWFDLKHFCKIYYSYNELQTTKKKLFKMAAICPNTAPMSVKPFINRCMDDIHRKILQLLPASSMTSDYGDSCTDHAL